MSYADAHPGYRLETEEQARAWLRELLEDQRRFRKALVEAPKADLRAQRKASTELLVKYGSVLGSIAALHRCDRLSDDGYEEFKKLAMEDLAATPVAPGPQKA